MFTARHFVFFHIFKSVSAGKEDSYTYIIFVKLYPIWTEWKTVSKFSQFFKYRKQCIYSTNGRVVSFSCHWEQLKS